VLGWDVMNEPEFGDKMITLFIEHFTNIISNYTSNPPFACDFYTDKESFR
jgi:hypothetical protein